MKLMDNESREQSHTLFYISKKKWPFYFVIKVVLIKLQHKSKCYAIEQNPHKEGKYIIDFKTKTKTKTITTKNYSSTLPKADGS